MSEPTTYRVWDEVTPPLSRAHWWLLDHHLLGWPGRGAWLDKAVRGVRSLAEQHGLTLIGDPIPGTVQRGRKVAIVATALAVGPPGLAVVELAPVDVVDRDRRA